MPPGRQTPPGTLPYRGQGAPGPTSASPRITAPPSLKAGLERLAANLRRRSGTGDCCTYLNRHLLDSRPFDISDGVRSDWGRESRLATHCRRTLLPPTNPTTSSRRGVSAAGLSRQAKRAASSLLSKHPLTQCSERGTPSRSSFNLPPRATTPRCHMGPARDAGNNSQTRVAG